MATFSIDVSFAANTDFGGCGLGVRGEVTRNGDNFVAENQNIGFSAAEAVTIGDVGAGTAFFYLRNADPTNVVILYSDGASGTKEIGRLSPGKAACGFAVTGVTFGAKALVAGCLLEKLVIENVGLSLGSLSMYAPSTPSAGTAVETVIITAQLGTASVAIVNTVTEAIASCGYLSHWTAVESGFTELWPDDDLNQGTGYGTIMLLNRSVDETGLIAETAGTKQYGEAVPFNGFILIPINAAAITSAIQGDGSPVTVTSIATRKTL